MVEFKHNIYKLKDTQSYTNAKPAIKISEHLKINYRYVRVTLKENEYGKLITCTLAQ